MKKNILIMVLPSIIIISCWYMLVPGGRIKEEIKALNAKNDSLRLANKVLKENIMANEIFGVNFRFITLIFVNLLISFIFNFS